MSVSETKTVDVIGIDKASGEVVLTISDHLDWEDVTAHLLQLQEKLNTYLAFIESGEMLESYPKSAGRRARIEIVAKYPLHPQGVEFIARSRAVIVEAGFDLEHKMIED
jgi:hypothetical protein